MGKYLYINYNVEKFKMFCANAKCMKKTFSERYDFVDSKGEKRSSA